MRLLAVLGRPGTDAPVFARLLSARLRATETVSVRVAATAELNHRTQLGMQISQRVGPELDGNLLPSALVAPLVQARLQRAQMSDGTCVFSGFPRTQDQLRMLHHAGLETPRILHLVLSRSEAEQRVAGRRICDTSGEPMYPAPAIDGAPSDLYQYLIESECDKPSPRQDALDLPPALERRLNAYEEHTVPLLDALRGRGAVCDIPLGETAQATWDAVLAACGLPPDELEKDGVDAASANGNVLS